MSKNSTLKDKDRWLAAEYALGVADSEAKARAEKLADRDVAFRREVDAWNNQLSPLLDEVDEVAPPKSVWRDIERSIAPSSTVTASAAQGLGFWKLMTGLTSTVAAACFGLFMYVSGGEIGSGSVPELKQRLQASQNNIIAANEAFEQARKKSVELEQQLVEATGRFESANAELAEVRKLAEDRGSELAQANNSLQSALANVANAEAEVAELRKQFNESRPLVASLTQSGDAPAFVAQYDPLKQALLIRTAVEDEDEKVPEIWLIPAEGDRKGEVLSLGVMDESAPDVVPISDEFVKLIGEGGTLAITMEPPGGSPTGVATGPVIALGQLQAF